MPTTWYVGAGGGAVAVDSSEVDAVSVLVKLGELCAAVPVGGRLVVFASAVGISAVVSFVELCVAVSVGGTVFVFASAVGVSAVVRPVCAAVSIRGELVVFFCAVAGVGDVATDTLLG